jgi:hypothetical protein
MRRSFANRREHTDLSGTGAWITHASNVSYIRLPAKQNNITIWAIKAQYSALYGQVR